MNSPDIILVGIGNYRKLAIPALHYLHNAGEIGKVIPVDILPKNEIVDKENIPKEDQTFFNSIMERYYQRGKDEPIQKVVDRIGSYEPIVILATPNDIHVLDTLFLLEKSKSNPSVLVEKPYALHQQELSTLEQLMSDHPGKVGLLEYYLSMKTIPLLIFGGVVREDSFYFEDNGIIKPLSKISLSELSGRLEEKIGEPKFVLYEILEGEGDYGKIDHRTPFIIDTLWGGGMIHDLGTHILAPLLALQDYLGDFTVDSVNGFRVAFCNEYVKLAKETIHIPENRIGESYAEFDLQTSNGVPVSVAFGKYVQAGTNQRRLIINGTRGVVLYDMTNNVLAIMEGDRVDSIVQLVQAEKENVPKYLGVLLAGIRTLQGFNPFKFDSTRITLDAQRFILELLNLQPNQVAKYTAGTMHDEIF